MSESAFAPIARAQPMAPVAGRNIDSVVRQSLLQIGRGTDDRYNNICKGELDLYYPCRGVWPFFAALLARSPLRPSTQ
jgi:hypothetical protein